jgi:hypothetical protein
VQHDSSTDYFVKYEFGILIEAAGFEKVFKGKRGEVLLFLAVFCIMVVGSEVSNILKGR